MADLLVELSTESGKWRGHPVDWGRIVLEDSQGRVLSQSGAPSRRVDGGRTPSSAGFPLPLGAWMLRAEYWERRCGGRSRELSPGRAGSFLSRRSWAASLMSFTARVRANSARPPRRVGFVNQVSHELRTPLTNIRLYAELLERRLDEDEENRSYLDIIVAECARLSRLIGNVLTFARRSRGALTVHPVEGSVDETLRSVADQFRPSFEAKGMEIALDLDAPRPFAFDPDAVEQIVGNLLSNVEKYAAAGRGGRNPPPTERTNATHPGRGSRTGDPGRTRRNGLRALCPAVRSPHRGGLGHRDRTRHRPRTRPPARRRAAADRRPSGAPVSNSTCPTQLRGGRDEDSRGRGRRTDPAGSRRGARGRGLRDRGGGRRRRGPGALRPRRTRCRLSGHHDAGDRRLRGLPPVCGRDRARSR